jgi:hypothetical protein
MPSPADDPLDRLAAVRAQLKSVTEADEDTGQFDVTKQGVSAKGMPKWAMGLFGVLLAVALVVAAAGWAISQLK